MTRVILFGATGMVGHGVLTALLEDPSIERVTAVSRRPSGRHHAKLREVLHADFTDFSGLADVFRESDATLFCLGTTSLGLTEPEYTRITVDFAVAAARANPGGRFVYISANRADSASPTMWIRVKGQAEQALLAVAGDVFLLRPGLIRPCRGARPATRLQRVTYAVLGPFFPLLNRLFPAQVTSTDAIAYAILEILHAPGGVPKKLDNTLINQVALRGRDRVAG